MSAALRDDRYRRADFYHFMEPAFAERFYGFPPIQEDAQRFTADDGSKWLYEDAAWEKTNYAPSRWMVRKRNSRWYVIRDQDGASLECHYSWPEAMERVTSLAGGVS